MRKGSVSRLGVGLTQGTGQGQNLPDMSLVWPSSDVWLAPLRRQPLQFLPRVIRLDGIVHALAQLGFDEKNTTFVEGCKVHAAVLKRKF